VNNIVFFANKRAFCRLSLICAQHFNIMYQLFAKIFVSVFNHDFKAILNRCAPLAHSGRAALNANFEPISDDWRKRIKQRKNRVTWFAQKTKRCDVKEWFSLFSMQCGLEELCAEGWKETTDVARLQPSSQTICERCVAHWFQPGRKTYRSFVTKKLLLDFLFLRRKQQAMVSYSEIQIQHLLGGRKSKSKPYLEKPHNSLLMFCFRLVL